jgi:hypothetical protein
MKIPRTGAEAFRQQKAEAARLQEEVALNGFPERLVAAALLPISPPGTAPLVLEGSVILGPAGRKLAICVKEDQVPACSPSAGDAGGFSFTCHGAFLPALRDPLQLHRRETLPLPVWSGRYAYQSTQLEVHLMDLTCLAPLQGWCVFLGLLPAEVRL